MWKNQTLVTEFILLGFPIRPEIQIFLFLLFTLFYALTLLGNGIILGLICLDSHLHIPMYFFLSHLAIVDISYASNNVPKMLVNLLNKDRAISFAPYSLIMISSTYLDTKFGCPFLFLIFSFPLPKDLSRSLVPGVLSNPGGTSYIVGSMTY
uniref:G-protein coupled receptors family 1 profile domain-containing protein n=1 Tax=Vombatus ursinus TaxID=29139 RepID=A0A4X2M1D2_VOMUR